MTGILPSRPVRSREVPVRGPVPPGTLTGRDLVHENLKYHFLNYIFPELAKVSTLTLMNQSR